MELPIIYGNMSNNSKETEEQKELDDFVIDGNHDVPTKMLRYIRNCLDGILLHKENLVPIQNPKISVVVPIFNRERFIKACIRSIQNQKMKEIEIIMIEDQSLDTSLTIEKNLKAEDPRINLIVNEKRRGAFYNRIIGVEQAKAKYILFIDSDDLFIREDFLIEYIMKQKKVIMILLYLMAFIVNIMIFVKKVLEDLYIGTKKILL